jgi:hypothetical protein
MTRSDSEVQTSRKSAFIVALLILVMAVSVLITAHGYSGGSGIFPRFIGWVFLALISLELVFQIKGFVKRPASSADHANTAGSDRAIVLKEIQGFLWIGFFLLLLYLGGFLISIPVYMFAFLRFSAKRTMKDCVLMSVGSTLFVYLLFIQLMEYRLYSGILVWG